MAENAETVLKAHQRIGNSNLGSTKAFLEDLGFAENGQLLDRETREQRAGLLRRWYT